MRDEAVRSKLEGCLLGVAVGDAMGMPSELWSTRKVEARFGRITGFLPGPEDHHIVRGFKAGQFTDDTGQSLALAEAIIGRGGDVAPDAVAAALLAWAEETDAFDTPALGPSSKKALLAIRAGTPVSEAGGTGDTNGAAMRIAPVGMVSRPNDTRRLVDRVERACLPTHHTNVAIAGAAMLAAAIATAVETSDWDEILGNAARAYGEGMERGNDVFGASSLARLQLTLQLAKEEPDEARFSDRLYDLVGAGVSTTEAVPASIAIAYYSQGDPIRAALLAANLGGDCDTVGAMTGGLCGAYAGMGGFPEGYVRTIREVNGMDVQAVARLLAPFRS